MNSPILGRRSIRNLIAREVSGHQVGIDILILPTLDCVPKSMATVQLEDEYEVTIPLVDGKRTPNS